MRDKMGWLKNQDLGLPPIFYSGDQLFDSLHRPDLLQRSLETGKTTTELAQELNLHFDLQDALRGTPVVRIAEFKDGSSVETPEISVHVIATDLGHGVHNLALYHNGKRVPEAGPMVKVRNGEQAYEKVFVISMIPGVNSLMAQAANEKKTLSSPAEIKLNYQGVQVSSTLHILAIGLNHYANPKYNLTYCVPDIEATAKAFQQRAGGLFAEVKLHTLTDDQATKVNLQAKFAELAKTVKPSDLFILCYAGHGVMGEPLKKGDDAMFYLVPHDVTRLYGDPELLAEKAVSRTDLQDWCAAVPARKQLMLLDTCQSGGLVDSYAMRGAAEEKALAQLARATGTVVIASTGAEAFARESKTIGHGIFTQVVLDGLNDAKADGNKDGKITVKELETYISEAVPELSKKLTNTPQFPTSYARGQDFPIGIVK